MKKSILIAIALSFAICRANAQMSDFENLNTLLGYNQSWNGSGKSIESKITSGGVNLKTNLTKGIDSEYWSDWTFSKVKNTTLAGYANDRAAITNGGAGNSTNYAVGYGVTNILKFNELVTVNGFQISNATYPYLSMRDGDSFSKKFGGQNGTDPDFFVVSINGYKNGVLNTTVGFSIYLSDFRSNITQEDFILNTWKTVDLTMLGAVDSLKFELKSSDNGMFGMNTPAYFVVDNISTTGNNFMVADFENYTLDGINYFKAPSVEFSNTITSGIGMFKNTYTYNGQYDYDSWTGFAFSKVNNTVLSGISNQYASAAGKGFNNSSIYAISYSDNEILLNTAQTISGFYATNTTYAFNSMRDGDSFAKKFGGIAGNEPDYFRILIKGFRNGVFVDSTTHYLADFRNSISSEDFISNTWKWVDLSKLGMVDKITFSFKSSDVGQFGINTPQYFALDDFNGVAPLVSTIGIIENIKNQVITIYPNPAQNEFSVAEIDGDFELEIISNTAQTIFRFEGNQLDKINIKNLFPGVYIVKIKTKNNQYIKKLIKE